MNMCKKMVAVMAFAVSVPTIMVGYFMLGFVSFNQNLAGGLAVLCTGVAMLTLAIILCVNKIMNIANIGLILCNIIVGSFCLHTAINWWGRNPILINVILPLVVLFMAAVSIGFSVTYLVNMKYKK